MPTSERPPAPEPINIDRVFGPETSVPEESHDTSIWAGIRDREECEGKIRRALYHRALGKTDDLYDPQDGEVITTTVEGSTKYYSVDGQTFLASVFEGPIVLDEPLNGQIRS